MTQRWQPLLVGLLVLSGCTGEPGIPGGGGPETTYVGGDAGTVCAHPEEGCACDPEQPPIDCYLEPIVGEDGQLTCSRGTRYCRDEVWTGCESVQTYQFRSGPGIAGLVTGPTACNPCDPACAVSRDIPSGADLPGHSTGLGYDPGPGGIGLIPTTTGTGALPDADGDGVPDIADDCAGPGAVRGADGTCGGAYFYHDLPYGGPAEIDPLDINVQVRTADVYFLMDTTGSMGGEIYNLRTSLTSGTYIAGCSGGIIGAIRCTIPDAWFGVGYHDDYPVSPYGSAGWDNVYRNLQDITSSVSAAQTAVNSLALHSGNDGPESQTQALWAIASGGGLGPYLGARSGCAAGHWGYPCFRPGTIPIVILFTDAPFHNGPYGYNYSFGGTGGTTLPATTAVGGNDTQGSAYFTGDAATTWRGFTGSTCGFADNYWASCAYNYSADVVFRFTVSTTTTLTFSLEGSTYDTLLSIHNSGFGQIACNDDYVGLQSKIVMTLGPGTYYAVVQGYAGGCGSYRFSIGNPAAAAPPPATAYPVTWAQTVSELNRTGIRMITVHSGGSYGLVDAQALADATGSYSSTGSRYVFPIGYDGTGLSRAVVDAVVDLANYNRMDISARAVDNATSTTVDERGFVDAITAVSWGPGSCSGISGGSTFVQCLPGTSVDFRISFRNDIVMPTAVPQVFTFWIEVLGDGTFVLARIPVRIVVPANVPLYPPSGSYWQEYDSDLHCAATERPDWNTLSWVVASMPAGTSIRWELRTSETAAGLATAPVVSFTTPTATSPADVGARLVSAGQTNYQRFLRVTAVLNASPDRTQTPVLRSFELRYTCIPQE